MYPDTGPSNKLGFQEPEEDDGDIHLPVNIGNPGEFTVSDLANKVLALVKTESFINYSPLPIDDPRIRRPDIRRAESILGWKPVVELDEGIVKTAEYFRSIIKQDSK